MTARIKIGARAVGAVAATAAATLAIAGPAGAHVTLNPAEGPADGYATLGVQVPHGCGDAATRVVRVQIPESVASVTPAVHAGWEVTTKEGPKEPVEVHGETVDRGVAEVIWTVADGQPLPSDRLDVFAMSVKLPAGAAGDTVHFPTVQECVGGEREAWIQVADGDESGDELDYPAPSVTLTAAAAGHHGADDGTGGDADAASLASTTADDGGSSNGLAIVALVLGALGLLTGLAALTRARRTAA